MASRKRRIILISISVIAIILAVFIGLFIRVMFFTSNYMGVDDRNDEMDIRLRDQINSSGKILVFDRLSIDAKRGDKVQLYYGLKNTASEEYCYAVQIECIQSMKHLPEVEDICSYGASDPIVGGHEVDSRQMWFQTFPTLSIQNGEIMVAKMIFQVSDLSEDTYMMRLNIYQAENGGDCYEAGDTFNFDSPYVKQDFWIELTS